MQEVCLQSATKADIGADGQAFICSPAATEAFDKVFKDGRMDKLNTKVRHC